MFIFYSAFVNNDTRFFGCFFIGKNRRDKINQFIILFFFSNWKFWMFFQLFLFLRYSIRSNFLIPHRRIFDNLEDFFVFHHAKSTQIEKFVILYPNLAILVNFEISKLLVKTSEFFLLRRYEKVPICFNAFKQDFWKNKCSNSYCSAQKNFSRRKMIQEDEYLN